jgi:hypothetical protein
MSRNAAVYQLWLEHADDLRADLGAAAAEELLDEAESPGIFLDPAVNVAAYGAERDENVHAPALVVDHLGVHDAKEQRRHL